MRLIVCLFLSGLLLLSSNASSAEKQTITKKQAVELALTDFSGRTLKITEQGDYFIVRILQSNGRIVDLKVNKVTGEVKKD
ncbi:PepSY domain-containing protein [Pseudoalteromonas sp. MMG012]|uniref:PepSY domain-containing protein n=1 Tax=Pseudoalteromonas sp. MMG012 TaxID=2822686 RepID=UPI001B3A015E|nr:PepSY domain-containing protein [Pseudoalteromonas sp. MMG012]MBQ4849828.1 PepSY domain-containing protein [Pseudoalteromonas sp. MMG012]